MKWLKNLPLAVYSLLMPGVVFLFVSSYRYIHSLVPLCILTCVVIGFSTLHFGKPLAAPKALNNFPRSRVSIEMLLSGLFLLSMVVQILFFPENQTVFFLVIGSGVTAGICSYGVYTDLARSRNKIYVYDLLFEVVFIAYFLGNTLYDVNYFTSDLIIFKLIKDVPFSAYFLFSKKDRYFASTLLISIIALFFLHTPFVLYLFLFNSILIRTRFFMYLEVSALEAAANELRQTYLPKKYLKYMKKAN